MADYLIPAFFLGIGLTIGARAAWLRGRQRPVPAMFQVLGLFALGAGAFLLALLIMCAP